VSRAGRVARDGEGRVVGKGDLVVQFRQVCANLKTLVTAAGGSLTDVVKLTIYVIDTTEFKRQGKPIGVVYREYFGKHYPAMTLVGVRDLYDASEGCLIEIDGFACLAGWGGWLSRFEPTEYSASSHPSRAARGPLADGGGGRACSLFLPHPDRSQPDGRRADGGARHGALAGDRRRLRD